MHYCGCKGTTKLQLLQRVFQRMLTTQRMTATQQMLSEISWKGTTEFMSDLACTRTKQLCDEMSGFISSTMLEGFILAAGGRDPALTGGGGSGESMIRWDGKKKKSSWER